MVCYINTIADFLRIREEIKPVYITSKTHGKVSVPCVNTLLVKTDLIIANGYNPNFVPGDKMRLLMQSILDNGFCFPVVSIWDDEQETFVIIDGFHRNDIGSSRWLDFDYVPLVILPHNIKKRMVATVQFNKARGVHQVDLDAELIRRLIEQGMSDQEISARLGIEEETVHRYKSLTGVADLFKNAEWSMSWSMEEQE